MEIALYMIVAPILTATIIFIFGFNKMNTLIGSSILFFLLSLPAVALPIMGYNVGVEAIYGWALFFSAVSLVGALGIRHTIGTFKKSEFVIKD